MNVYHLYHVCQALWGIEIKQSDWVSHMCVHLYFVFWNLRLGLNGHLSKCDVWQWMSIRGFRGKETPCWDVVALEKLPEDLCGAWRTCVFWIDRQVEGGAPRESVSQSFVVQLSSGPIESRSDSGTWEIAPDWLHQTRCKGWVGICCYW